MSYNPEFKNDLYNRYYRMMERRKSQMTREEALNKLKTCRGSEADRVLGYLEALELIKFEEEDSPSVVIKNTHNDMNIHNNIFTHHMKLIEADQIVDALMKAGYKIVRKDAS